FVFALSHLQADWGTSTDLQASNAPVIWTATRSKEDPVMAKQPLDPYLQPELMILADGQPRSAGQYHQQLFQRIQANVSLRHESWKAADHPQFQQLSMLVAAALVKAGLLDASDQGELTITAQGRKLLATHPRLITFNDLRRF